MARNQKNFSWQLYVDDNAGNWNVHGESGGALSGSDGHATFDPSKPVFGKQSVRRHVRRALYQDPVTFRTITPIVYTPSAMSGLTLGSTLAVQVTGLATTVNYTLVDKLPEKIHPARASRNLADS